MMPQIYSKVSFSRFFITQNPPETILTHKNLIVYKINDYMLDLLLGEERKHI